MKTKLLLLILCLLCSSPLFAETIVLKSGKTVEGAIIEKTDDYIKINLQEIEITYYMDDIKSIDGKDVVNIKISSNDPNVLIAFWEAAIKDNPSNYNAYNELGLGHSQLENLHKALSYFEKAIQIRPDYPVAYGYAGATYNSLKKPDKAIQYLEKAIELGSQDIIIYNSLGWSYFFTEQYEKAIPYFKRVLAANSENIKTLIALGVAYKSSGQINQAEEYFLKAKEILYKQGKYEAANSIDEQYLKN